MTWILLHFFLDFFEQNTLNSLYMLCFCHPKFFLLLEQLMTGCCYPCNVVHFSAIPCNLCLVEQQSSPFVQWKLTLKALSIFTMKLLIYYLSSLDIFCLYWCFQSIVRMLCGNRLPKPVLLPCFLHSPSR